MVSSEVAVQNSVGLHARPATFFIQRANEFKSSIWVEKDEKTCKRKEFFWEFFHWVSLRVHQYQSLLTVVMKKRQLRLWLN